MDIEILVGKRVRLARQMANLSQDDLAARAGQTQWQISNTETAQRHTTITQLAAIADALGRPLIWFLIDGDIVPVEKPQPPDIEQMRREALDSVLSELLEIRKRQAGGQR